MSAIEIQCAQGSAEWHAHRLGKPTASRFAAILTPAGKPTRNAARTAYMAELLQERLTGAIADNVRPTAAMEAGTQAEPQARAWYEVETGHTLRQVGFLDAGRWGYSPDALCVDDADRLIEIKRPLPKNLIPLLLEDAREAAADYWMQCQGGLWIAERAVCDLVLFSDTVGIPSRIISIERDEKLCAAFEVELPAFCDELDVAETKLRAMGGGLGAEETI